MQKQIQICTTIKSNVYKLNSKFKLNISTFFNYFKDKKNKYIVKLLRGNNSQLILVK